VHVRLALTAESLLTDSLSPVDTDIYDSLKATGYEAPSAENVVVEIFDILGCNDARYCHILTPMTSEIGDRELH
jgi:hypothetical protein